MLGTLETTEQHLSVPSLSSQLVRQLDMLPLVQKIAEQLHSALRSGNPDIGVLHLDI